MAFGQRAAHAWTAGAYMRIHPRQTGLPSRRSTGQECAPRGKVGERGRRGPQGPQRGTSRRHSKKSWDSSTESQWDWGLGRACQGPGPEEGEVDGQPWRGWGLL